MLSKQSAVSKPLITEREMCICSIVMETKTTFNPFGLKKMAKCCIYHVRRKRNLKCMFRFCLPTIQKEVVWIRIYIHHVRACFNFLLSLLI